MKLNPKDQERLTVFMTAKPRDGARTAASR